MTKIYKRNTIKTGKSPKKDHNRKRGIIMNFRVSEDEQQQIFERVKLSGVKRNDFFIDSCINQKIVTYGNVKTFEAIEKRLDEISNKLLLNEKELDSKDLITLKTILDMLDGLKSRKEEEICQKS